jgi:hypothetical protein
VAAVGSARYLVSSRGSHFCWASLSLLLLCIPTPARCAVHPLWSQRLSGSSAPTSALKVAAMGHDRDDNLVVTGNVEAGVTGRDVLTIKYSAIDGSVIWSNRFNSTFNGDDTASELAVDNQGNVVVTGTCPTGEWSWGGYQSGSQTLSYFTIKYSGNTGEVLWDNRHGAFDVPSGMPLHVACDSLGNVLTTGRAPMEFLDFGVRVTYWVCYTAKFAASGGQLLWKVMDPGSVGGSLAPTALVVDSENNVVVVGDPQEYTVKYSGDSGRQIWSVHQPRDGALLAVTVDAVGNVLVSGADFGGSLYFAKISKSGGTTLWEARFRGLQNYGGLGTTLAVDGSGDVIVTGYSTTGDYDHLYDGYLMKLSGVTGNQMWQNIYKGILPQSQRLHLDRNDDVTIAWMSFLGENSLTPNARYFGSQCTARFSGTNGSMLWKRSELPMDESDALPGGTALAVDSQAHVYRAGYYTNQNFVSKYSNVKGETLWNRNVTARDASSSMPSWIEADRELVTVVGVSGKDYWTVRYRRGDGSVLWDRRFAEMPGYVNRPLCMGLDRDGNVILAGALGPNAYTTKYDGVDGRILWERTVAGSEAEPAQHQSIAVERTTGNFAVTGFSGRSSFTIKYSANDGSILWKSVYDGTSGSTNRSVAIAIDSNGDVVVSGNSWRSNSVTSSDIYAIKYSGRDGRMLWQTRYDGPAGLEDRAQGLALDPSGNVFVAGYSENRWPTNLIDYHVWKQASDDGRLLWEYRQASNMRFMEWLQQGQFIIASDQNGDVFITYPLGLNYASVTCKLSGHDATKLWTASIPTQEEFHLGSQRYGTASIGLALDEVGNPITCVPVRKLNNTHDVYVTKRNSSDGASVWQRVLDGQLVGDDRAAVTRCVDVGPDGLVALALGVDGFAGDHYQMQTFAFQETLPPLRWDATASQLVLTFDGEPGSSYEIQRSDSLTGLWITLEVRKTPNNGVIRFVDSHPPRQVAFYRTRVTR